MSRGTLLHRVISACSSKGLKFRSLYDDDMGRWIVTCHDYDLSGKKPCMDEYRDGTDYLLMMDAWHRRGMRILAIETDPYDALEKAILYLENV